MVKDKFVIQHGSGYIEDGAARRHQNDCGCEKCRLEPRVEEEIERNTSGRDTMQPPKGVLGTQPRRDDGSPLPVTRGVLGRMADESKGRQQ